MIGAKPDRASHHLRGVSARVRALIEQKSPMAVEPAHGPDLLTIVTVRARKFMAVLNWIRFCAESRPARRPG